MRPVEACRHWECLRTIEDMAFASCTLLQTLTGLSRTDVPLVRSDTCAACCEHPEPTVERINPVLASLVNRLASGILTRGGVGACDAPRAASLAEWSRDYLRAEFLSGTTPSLPLRASEPCVYRGDVVALAGNGENSDQYYKCLHETHELTTEEHCHRCRDWSDRAGAQRPALASLLPRPSVQSSTRIKRWAVGMTTAPRGLSTVDWALDSVVRAGWGSVHFFEDSSVPLARRSSLMPATTRAKRLGAWPNFYLGLTELLMRDPHADAYLMAQDDALFFSRENLRGFLEDSLWPSDPPGLISLYCSSAYTQAEPGWHRHVGPWVWGALAFVFPNALARQFVLDPAVFDHRWNGPMEGLANIDGVIGRWAEAHAVPIHYPVPSLIQHIGDVSTLSRVERASAKRVADWFAEDCESR